MVWFKVDHHQAAHPAALKAGNAALGLWVRCGCWLSVYPKPDDIVPIEVARSFGTPAQIRRLVDSGLWVEAEGGYAMRRSMNIASSGLNGSFWAIERTDVRANIPERLRTAVHRRDGHACVECDSRDDLTLDHIHPWALGGEDSFENLRTLCRPCNSRKGARV